MDGKPGEKCIQLINLISYHHDCYEARHGRFNKYLVESGRPEGVLVRPYGALMRPYGALMRPYGELMRPYSELMRPIRGKPLMKERLNTKS